MIEIIKPLKFIISCDIKEGQNTFKNLNNIPNKNFSLCCNKSTKLFKHTLLIILITMFIFINKLSEYM